MFNIDQLGEKFSAFQSYFQTSNDLLSTILIFGGLVFVSMLILLRVSRAVMDKADRKKLEEFDALLDLNDPGDKRG